MGLWLVLVLLVDGFVWIFEHFVGEVWVLEMLGGENIYIEEARFLLYGIGQWFV